MRFAIVACRPTHTNEALAAAGASGVEWEPMTPEQALEELRPGDVALGRLDVLPSLDGVDDGLWVLGAWRRAIAAVLARAAFEEMLCDEPVEAEIA
jgi:hypothetical protein